MSGLFRRIVKRAIVKTSQAKIPEISGQKKIRACTVGGKNIDFERKQVPKDQNERL